MRVLALALALTMVSFLVGVAGDLSATTAQAAPAPAAPSQTIHLATP